MKDAKTGRSIRLFALCMTAVIYMTAILCLAACAAPEQGAGTTSAGTADAQISLFTADFPHAAAVSGDGYYCILRDRLYYLDAEDRMTPVCADLLCSHDTEDCAAYFPAPPKDASASVFCTDTGVYVLAGAADRRMTADGVTERSPKVLWKVDPENGVRKQLARFDVMLSPGSVTVYGSRLYCIAERYDEQAQASFELLSVSLEKGRIETVYACGEHAVPHCAAAYGNALYFSLTREGEQQRRWYRLDLGSRDAEPVYVAGDDALTAAPAFGGDGMILMRADPAAADVWTWTAWLYSAALTGEGQERIETAVQPDAYGTVHFDGRYIYTADNPYIPGKPQAEKMLYMITPEGETAAAFALGGALPEYECVRVTPGDAILVFTADGAVFRLSKEELSAGEPTLYAFRDWAPAGSE